MKTKTLMAFVPPAIDGFESIKRSWEPVLRQPCARILPGEFYVTPHDEVLMTVLGSCVSACIRAPRVSLGGMNHFMLPSTNTRDPADREARYGTYAMERLVNELVGRGARRGELEVKVVGGGQMYDSSSTVGDNNVRFVLDYLRNEGLTIVGQDLGGCSPRRVQYFPRSGRLRVKKLPAVHGAAVIQAERVHRDQLGTKPATGSIELF